MIRKKFGFFIILVICCSNSFANTTENQVFNSDIFSLSKQKEDAFDAPSATYIISSDDIRRSGITNIPDLLRMVPGVQVTKANNHTWDISVRGFNSQYSNKLLVLIDGRTVYTPIFSGVFWDIQDYPLEDIERVEVVKGPGGTIWGANAVNGVINIITKSASLTQGGYVSGLAGNQEDIGEIRYGNKTSSNDDYRVYAKKIYRRSTTKTSGADNQDGYRDNRAGFRYDVKSIIGSDIRVSGDTYQSYSQNYFPALNPGTTEQNNKNHQGGNILLNWNKELSKKSNFTLQSYFDYSKLDTPVLEISTKTVDVDFQHFYNFNKRNQFIWGLGYRIVADNIKEQPLTNGIYPLDYQPSQQNNNTYSAFIQDKIGLIADKLYLTIGSKFEHNYYTDYQYQPNAKLTYFPSDNQTVWTSVSRAVRTPTRAENGLSLRAGAVSGNSTITQQGSDQYKAEEEVSYEAGYRIKPTKSTLFDIALFYNDYNKLRTFEGTPPTAANLAYGTTKGLEITAKWQVTRDWRLEAGYDYLDMNIKAKDYSSPSNAAAMYLTNGQAPKNQFNLRSNYNITPKIEFDNMLYYVDSLPGSGTARTSAGFLSVPAYIRFDTRIAYLPVKNLELSLVGQNLTDEKHQEYRAALFNNQTEIGRAFYFKVLYGF